MRSRGDGMRELSITLPRAGITLRGKRGGVAGGVPTLCVHGWLDNCASFDPLLERLDGLDAVAIDLPGHGYSDRAPSLTCHYLDFVTCVLELARELRWERFQLIGHSLGGALSSLIAGIEPRRISRLVLIDAIGPLTTSPEATRLTVARYLDAFFGPERQPVYRSRTQAVSARVQLADLLLDTAERLVERDLHEVAGGFSWRSDIRLKHPAPRTFSEEQVLAFLRAIRAPTLLVTAERTALTEPFYPGRIAAVPDLEQVTLAGGHHLHMENPDAVAAAVRAFLAADVLSEVAA